MKQYDNPFLDFNNGGNNNTNKKKWKFPLAPMGVLAPGSAHVGIFWGVYISLFCDYEPPVKFQISN